MDSMPSRSPAEELFAHFLKRVNAGEDVDFKEVCRQHPDLADELRSLSVTHSTDGAGSTRASNLSPIANEIFERLSGRPAIQGRYKLEGEVARGGMGAILRVWDEDLHRHLAMKVVLGRETGEATSAHDLDAMTLGRFLEEAQVTGQLDHPGIVPVHEVGLDAEGHLFFTMKLVKGRDLRQIYALVREGTENWSITRAIGVLMRVCEAMAYAHDKGVVHRDLKPGNVMVGRFGEVYVMDWGLAKVLGQDDSRDLRIRDDFPASTILESDRQNKASEDPSSPLLTMDGDILGTPAYMSPEQAGGRLGDMGPHSDVYSLGAMLYQLLAGHAPYAEPTRRRSHLEVLALVRSKAPDPLAELAPDAPGEIVAITEKAMAREPADRYPDMSAFADDLRAYLEGRVVRAYETGAMAELRKWVRRNRGFAAAVVVAMLSLVIGLAVSLNLRSEAVRQSKNVLRLSSFQDLLELREKAQRLWPIHPDNIEAYEKWLLDAEGLVAQVDAAGGHRDQLGELRSQAVELDPESLEQRMSEHERYEELRQLEGRIEAFDYARAVREKKREPGIYVPDAEERALPAGILNDAMAWHMVDPERDDFGREAEGLELARLAVEKARGLTDLPPGKLSNYIDSLAWGYFYNGLDANARAASQEALDLAPPAQRASYRANQAKLNAAILRATDGTGLAQVDLLREQAAQLRNEIAGEYARTFADESTRWWHNQLSLLVRELEALDDSEAGLVRGVSKEFGLGIEDRLACARKIELLTQTGQDAVQAWEDAIEELANNERYDGVELSPQVGLLPLGADPESDLLEFAHVASGEIPLRGSDGILRITPQSCIVLVLIPGGTFQFGAQGEDPNGPNFDPRATEEEGPVREVPLDPFFLSKYELTQAQWVHFRGHNPSRFLVGTFRDGTPFSWRSPVEEITWGESRKFLNEIDLELPTEAQWEMAARAGTDTPWSMGFERDCLMGSANIKDRTAQRAGEPFAQLLDWTEFEDGYPDHAPVGTFLPNAFGLHEMYGNVSEWCLDLSGPNHFPLRPGDGLRMRSIFRMYRSRGGSFADDWYECRSTSFLSNKSTYGFTTIGVRPARSLRP